MKTYAMVLDGQGGLLGDFGNPEKMHKAAARAIGCKETDLKFIKFYKLNSIYFFDDTQENAAYWLAALNITNDVPCFIGKRGQPNELPAEQIPGDDYYDAADAEAS
jgi:hypothetical protein